MEQNGTNGTLVPKMEHLFQFFIKRKRRKKAKKKK